jgi:16S rRNA (cytosine1402-N4)-methyltransferase
MLAECTQLLQPRAHAVYVDATVGLGGHAEAIMDATDGRAQLLGLDRDPAALHAAARRLARFGAAARLRKARLSSLAAVVREEVGSADGILIDLGVSSMQLEDPGRGFSFRAEGPLDMRMGEDGSTAAELVNWLPESELANLIYQYGEERRSRAVAREIVKRRPLATTGELAAAVRRAVPRRGRLDPATRSFQAIRIAVNEELSEVTAAIPQAVDVLRPSGRVVVLSYHSLEDGLVKRAMEYLSGRCRCASELPTCQCGARRRVTVLTRKPLRPSAAETERNPRARSARLRACERLPEETQ